MLTLQRTTAAFSAKPDRQEPKAGSRTVERDEMFRRIHGNKRFTVEAVSQAMNEALTKAKDKK